MLSMGYNLLCSLRKVHAHTLVEKVIFWAVDKEAVKQFESYRRLNKMSFGIYHPHTEHQMSEFQSIGSNGYYQMMRERSTIHLKLLKQFHLSFLFMDTDLIFTSDPLNDLFLNEDKEEIEDIIYSTDARNFYNQLEDPFEGQPFIPKICGGFFLMRSSPPTIRLLEDLNKAIYFDPNANDQWTI
jgi:hypothetical protein